MHVLQTDTKQGNAILLLYRTVPATCPCTPPTCGGGGLLLTTHQIMEFYSIHGDNLGITQAAEGHDSQSFAYTVCTYMHSLYRIHGLCGVIHLVTRQLIVGIIDI